jgi:hypothetical protein
LIQIVPQPAPHGAWTRTATERKSNNSGVKTPIILKNTVLSTTIMEMGDTNTTAAKNNTGFPFETKKEDFGRVQSRTFVRTTPRRKNIRGYGQAPMVRHPGKPGGEMGLRNGVALDNTVR